MYLISQSKPDDAATLFKLARMVYFINLPPDEKIISAKINHSRTCFNSVAGVPESTDDVGRRGRGSRGGLSGLKDRSDVFMFTIIDTDTDSVIGSSQIISKMGGPGHPNWSFKLSEMKFHSKGLNFGTTHTVARLHGDETGPSEVGGLILAPSHRGSKAKPGKFLGLVRFQFAALHPERFAKRVIAEMAAPVTADGDNLFWDAIGRKFIPVKYAEADRFCQHNRDFIPELLPKEDVYLTLLPLEVMNQVAQVGEETRPARRMLENLGFEYKGHIDPFDGGPHLEAVFANIPLVRDTKRADFLGSAEPEQLTHAAIVSVLQPDGEFRAVQCNAAILPKGVRLTSRVIDALGLSAGAKLGVTPLGPIDAELGDANFGRRSGDKSAPTSKPAPKPTPKPRTAKSASPRKPSQGARA